MSDLLGIAEVAKRAALSQKAVRRAIDRGELVASKMCGRIRVAPEAFDRWVSDSTIRPDVPVHVRPVKLSAAHGLRSLLADETREEQR